ncbi:MAG: Uma2 family endonuclease [Egibacteraceae bacterium]
MSSPAQTTRYTYDDLASFPDDGLRRELIGGELIVSPAPRLRHQRVVAEFTTEFTLHTRAHGGTVFPAPTDVYLTHEDVVEPDVLFVRPEHSDRIEDKFVRSAPDIVVEVSSPSTRHLELVRKRDLYERHGVPEYWHIDLDADSVQVSRLDRGRYSHPETLTRRDKLTSPLLPGFAVAIDELLGPQM